MLTVKTIWCLQIPLIILNITSNSEEPDTLWFMKRGPMGKTKSDTVSVGVAQLGLSFFPVQCIKFRCELSWPYHAGVSLCKTSNCWHTLIILRRWSSLVQRRRDLWVRSGTPFSLQLFQIWSLFLTDHSWKPRKSSQGTIVFRLLWVSTVSHTRAGKTVISRCSAEHCAQ